MFSSYSYFFPSIIAVQPLSLNIKKKYSEFDNVIQNVVGFGATQSIELTKTGKSTVNKVYITDLSSGNLEKSPYCSKGS